MLFGDGFNGEKGASAGGTGGFGGGGNGDFPGVGGVNYGNSSSSTQGGYGGASYEGSIGWPPPDLGGGGGGGFGSSTGRIHGDSNVHVLPDDADAILYRLVVRKLADIFVEKKLESLVTASAATC